MKSKRILIAVVILTVLFGAQCQREISVPEELIGVWQTSNPHYADRSFEIKKMTIIFEQGGGYFDFVTYPIVKVEQTFEGEKILYILSYITGEADMKYRFSFYYNPAGGGVIVFKNQPELKWTKKKS